MAQRLAFKQLNVANQQMRCIVPMNWKAMKVAVGDRIQLSVDELSWSNKIFVVEGWQFTPESGYNLTLQEDSSSAYADPTSPGDYSTRTLAGTVSFADQAVSAPSGLAATSEEEAIALEWDLPPRPSGYDEIAVYASASSAWSGASEIARTRSNTFRHELANGTQRYYWVRAIDVDGRESIRNPDSDTSSIQATAGQISTSQLDDDANFALTANWPDVTGPGRPEDNATENTGALADLDTVGTDEIDDSAITLAKFASSLSPVQVVSSLPGSAAEGDMAYLTTDNKLYRYNGTAWIKAVDGADVSSGTLPASAIVANSITAGQIQAGAIGATEISVTNLAAISADLGTVTAGSLASSLITGDIATFVTFADTSSQTVIEDDGETVIQTFLLPGNSLGLQPIIIATAYFNYNTAMDQDGSLVFRVRQGQNSTTGTVVSTLVIHHRRESGVIESGSMNIIGTDSEKTANQYYSITVDVDSGNTADGATFSNVRGVVIGGR